MSGKSVQWASDDNIAVVRKFYKDKPSINVSNKLYELHSDDAVVPSDTGVNFNLLPANKSSYTTVPIQSVVPWYQPHDLLLSDNIRDIYANRASQSQQRDIQQRRQSSVTPVNYILSNTPVPPEPADAVQDGIYNDDHDTNIPILPLQAPGSMHSDTDTTSTESSISSDSHDQFAAARHREQELHKKVKELKNVVNLDDVDDNIESSTGLSDILTNSDLLSQILAKATSTDNASNDTTSQFSDVLNSISNALANVQSDPHTQSQSQQPYPSPQSYQQQSVQPYQQTPFVAAPTQYTTPMQLNNAFSQPHTPYQPLPNMPYHPQPPQLQQPPSPSQHAQQSYIPYNQPAALPVQPQQYSQYTPHNQHVPAPIQQPHQYQNQPVPPSTLPNAMTFQQFMAMQGKSMPLPNQAPPPPTPPTPNLSGGVAPPLLTPQQFAAMQASKQQTSLPPQIPSHSYQPLNMQQPIMHSHTQSLSHSHSRERSPHRATNTSRSRERDYSHNQSIKQPNLNDQQKQFYKTRQCKLQYLPGGCKYGSKCTYLHSVTNNNQSQPQLPSQQPNTNAWQTNSIQSKQPSQSRHNTNGYQTYQ